MHTTYWEIHKNIFHCCMRRSISNLNNASFNVFVMLDKKIKNTSAIWRISSWKWIARHLIQLCMGILRWAWVWMWEDLLCVDEHRGSSQSWGYGPRQVKELDPINFNCRSSECCWGIYVQLKDVLNALHYAIMLTLYKGFKERTSGIEPQNMVDRMPRCLDSSEAS